jgi:tetratricopeptide (TPR) repeat protein
MRNPKTRRFVIAVLILGFGFVKIPMESALLQMQQDANFQQVRLDLEMREQLGQSGFIAALGGFRALVANLLWIKGYTEWEKTHWEKMRQIFNTVTTLQPSSLLFWDQSAWHLAWNAAKAARYDESIPLESQRIARERYYWEAGEDFLERGIRNNPNRYELYEDMAFLQERKFQNYCKAAKYYAKAAEFEEAPGYVPRFVGYMLAKCPGKEREAYQQLKTLYDMGEDQRLPSLIRDLKLMEEALDIPADQRIPDELPAHMRRAAPDNPSSNEN